MYDERVASVQNYREGLTVRFQQECAEAHATMEEWKQQGKQSIVDQSEKFNILIFEFKEHKDVEFRHMQNEMAMQGQQNQMSSQASYEQKVQTKWRIANIGR